MTRRKAACFFLICRESAGLAGRLVQFAVQVARLACFVRQH
jgi:hypothetical protein